jgi:ADP-dependent NAD(P)H-hydrate dehydratase / NAD(P)H-hydrate epimerase
MSPGNLGNLASRPASLEKGEWGKLLILAGSERFSGAAVLTTLGALRTGLDLAVVASPARAADAVLAAAPDAVTIRLDGTEFDPQHADDLEYFKSYPVAIGSGLTTAKPARHFLKDILKRFDGPFVIDADALTVLADEESGDWYSDKTVVLTPNREEYGALAGEAKPQPKRSIGAVAKRYGAFILCKGEVDIIGDGETVVEVEGGSEFLAKAGTGDVLTGVVGALLGRGLEPLEAAKAGAELVKEAGERAEKDKGPGLLASDIPGYLDLRNLS